MKPLKTLNVLGETMEILVDGSMTGGALAALVQTSPPGGGPPPHAHSREDEIFTVLEGDFEFLTNGESVKLSVGQPTFAPRGQVHSFRNAGTTEGKIHVILAPAGLERFFEKLARLTIPDDMPRIIELFAEYGLLSLQPEAAPAQAN
jgi:quercetin dioxygenase-like cupin family protein